MAAKPKAKGEAAAKPRVSRAAGAPFLENER